MSDITLAAKSRSLKGRKTDALRADDQVPAVVYGAGVEPQNIEIDRNLFVKTYNTAGESSLVDLAIDGKEPLQVLIQDYQQDPIKDFVTHVDFRVVDMNKPIDAVVRLKLVGESAAVKGLGGTLVQSRDTVSINCLPSKLVSSFEVDLAQLATFDDVIRISDLNVPEGVTITDDENMSIAVVTAPRTAAEMAQLDEAIEGDVADVAVEGDEKKEGEEASPDAEAGSEPKKEEAAE